MYWIPFLTGLSNRDWRFERMVVVSQRWADPGIAI